MKRLLTTITCFLFLIQLSGQNYFPFIQEGKIWAEIIIYDDFPPGGTPVIWTDYYKFEGDTSFQGKMYHTRYTCDKDSTMTNWTLDPMYYREDSNKVYISNLTNGDFLFYDFNLKVGDSALIAESMGYAKVIHVDSTLIGGSYRRTIHFDEPPDTWIEGIGSTRDPFEPLICFYLTGGSVDLLCVSDSSGQLYQNPSYNGCYVNITSAEEISAGKPDVRIFPNPCTTGTKIFFDLDGSERVNISLYNTVGQVVSEQALNCSAGKNMMTIDLSRQPAGSYYYRFTAGDLLATGTIAVVR